MRRARRGGSVSFRPQLHVQLSGNRWRRGRRSRVPPNDDNDGTLHCSTAILRRIAQLRVPRGGMCDGDFLLHAGKRCPVRGRVGLRRDHDSRVAFGTRVARRLNRHRVPDSCSLRAGPATDLAVAACIASRPTDGADAQAARQCQGEGAEREKNNAGCGGELARDPWHRLFAPRSSLRKFLPAVPSSVRAKDCIRVLSSTDLRIAQEIPTMTASRDHDESRMQAVKPIGHLPVLDGLRGIAILTVMVFHFFRFSGIYAHVRLDRVLWTLASFGWCGVDLFFVLSGFLITGILCDTRARRGFYRTFYARRFLRILPLYYAFLGFCFFVLPIVARHPSAYQVDVSGQLWEWSYLTNVRMAMGGWFFVGWTYLGHFWSLAVEEQFYLIWPAVVAWASPRGLLRTCGLLFLVALLIRTYLCWHGLLVASYVLTPTRMDSLAVGASLALIVRDPRLRVRAARWSGLTVALAGLGIVSIIVARRGFSDEDPVVSVLGIGLLALMFGSLLMLSLEARDGSPFKGVLTFAPLRFFGKYSYALYVFHQPLTAWLPRIGVVAMSVRGPSGMALPGQLLYTGIVGSISVLAAWTSWHVWEKHFIRLKDRFAYASQNETES